MRKLLLLGWFFLIVFGSFVREVEAGCWNACGGSSGCYDNCGSCPSGGTNYRCIKSGNCITEQTACQGNGSWCAIKVTCCDTGPEASCGSSSSTGTCTGSCSPNVVPNGTNWKYYSGWGRPYTLNNDRCGWRNAGTLCADVNGATSSFNYDTSSAISWECAADWSTGGFGADCSGTDSNARCCNTKHYNFCEGISDSAACAAATINGTNNNIDFGPNICKWYTNNECGPQHSNLASDFRASLLYQGNSECRAWTNSALSCGQAICDTACAYRDPQSAWMYFAAPASCNKACCTLVNGTCGSANGGYFNSAPASNLCGSGTASAVSGSGPWTWTCAGSCGGSTANCSANRATSYFVTFGGDVTLKGALVNQYLPSGAYISGK